MPQFPSNAGSVPLNSFRVPSLLQFQHEEASLIHIQMLGSDSAVSRILRRKPVPLKPIMALNPEPSDPVERAEQDLSPKSYATAAEEGLEQDDAGHAINVDAIKESPPRSRHTRNGSEPRPLGEVMEEVGLDSPRASSPTLRHPRGRLEDQGWDGDAPPALVNGTTNGNNPLGVNINGMNGMNGNREEGTFEGMGEDETPRSPIRKAHKRVSSRSLNSTPTKQQTSPKHEPSPLGLDGTTDEKLQDPGKLIYEKFRNKSGENLASIKPDKGSNMSLMQREDKPPTSEPPSDTAQLRRDGTRSGKVAGAGWGQSAIRWAPFHVPLQRRLQTVMVLFHTLSIVGGLAIFFLLCTIPLLWPILVPYLLYCLLSNAAVDGNLAHRWEWWRRNKIWSLFASYYPARLHRTQTLEPTRKYIFGYHPHGIISHGAFAAFATEALGFAQLFPGITNTLLTLDSNFRIPIYRDHALRMGLASVSRESCENILSKGGRNGEGMGRAITIVIGGARESLDAKPYTLRLVLKRRKGFVKLAIRTGADLVPVLAFGENDLYDQFDAVNNPYVHRAQLLVKKFMGFTVPLFHARGKSEYSARRNIRLLMLY